MLQSAGAAAIGAAEAAVIGAAYSVGRASLGGMNWRLSDTLRQLREALNHLDAIHGGYCQIIDRIEATPESATPLKRVAIIHKLCRESHRRHHPW